MMMILAISLGVTGITMASGAGGEIVEEIHELVANGFFIVVILHIAGVILHQLKHKDFLASSMVSGKKMGLPEDTQPVKAYTGVGVVLLLLTFGMLFTLTTNFDSNTRTLTLAGVILQLSEGEEHESEYEMDEEHEDEHD
jgi:quinol-cytochrome oxidoreductase complex cytochrome b subunit